ncbi:Phage Mu protein F like protein [Cohaesibacter sp. ES.047]|nr:Phage Mu protein F like protein [Cohaesibacter sp. ES.047]
MLEDFQMAIDDAIAKGMPLKGWLDKDDTYHPGFLDRFDEIVKKHGWDYKGGRNWRARVIYETNLKTAYAAGRYKQMTDPATLKAFPYWQYKHAWERIPLHPREEHEAWDGLILPADDPWWQTYYPPNGWKCGCGVRPVSRAKLKRVGKEGPDTAPSIQYQQKLDPGTGDPIDYPAGVDMGWAYAPGRTWADGLVPRELQRSAGRQMELPEMNNLPALSGGSKPVMAPLLPTGQTHEYYVSQFLEAFDADLDEEKSFRDKAGNIVILSRKLFQRADGSSKLNSTRAPALKQLAEAIMDPDEIWVDWEWHDVRKEWILKRRYLRSAPNLAGLLVFEWSQHGWSATTAYNAARGRKLKPNHNQINSWRRGHLLWQRK